MRCSITRLDFYPNLGRDIYGVLTLKEILNEQERFTKETLKRYLVLDGEEII